MIVNATTATRLSSVMGVIWPYIKIAMAYPTFQKGSGYVGSVRSHLRTQSLAFFVQMKAGPSNKRIVVHGHTYSALIGYPKLVLRTQFTRSL